MWFEVGAYAIGCVDSLANKVFEVLGRHDHGVVLAFGNSQCDLAQNLVDLLLEGSYA